MLFFSSAALFLTTLWNKGFIIDGEIQTYIKAALLVAMIYYLIRPLTKLVLLPLNILTMGLVSVAVYCLLFYFVTDFFSLIEISAWTFQGLSISKTANIFISAISVSTIINLIEHII